MAKIKASAPAPARSFNLWFWLPIALGAFLRAVYLLQSRQSPFFEPMVLDAGYYHEWALRILEGDWSQGKVFFGLPLYPAFLAAIYQFAGPSAMAVKIVQQTLGLLNVALVYAIAMQLFSRRAVAGLAAGIAAAYAPYVFHETIFIPETVGMPLYALALWLALRLREKPSTPRAAMTGLAIGLAGLTKAGIFLFLPAFVTLHLLKKGDAAPKKFREAAALVAAVLLCVAPVTLYNWNVGRDFVPLTAHGGLNFFIGNNPKSVGIYITPPGIRSNIEGQIADSRMIAERELGRPLKASEVSKYWAGLGRKYLFEHPRDAAILVSRKFAYLVNRTEISDVEDMQFSERFAPILKWLFVDFRILFALFLPGLCVGLRRAAPGKRSVVAVWLAAYTAGVLMYFVNARYRLPLVSVMAVLGAWAAVHAVDSLRTRRFARAALVALLAVIGFAAASPQIALQKTAVQFTHAGNIHMREKRYPEAIQMYKQAVEADPRYGKVHNDLGAAYQAMGLLDEAEAAFRKAFEIEPTSGYAANNLGLLLDRKGDSAQAKLLFEKALALQPNLPEAHNNLGMVLAKNQEYAAAEASFRRALELNPRSVKALTNLGMLAVLRGDKAEATRLWNAALEIDPNEPNARRALANLR